MSRPYRQVAHAYALVKIDGQFTLAEVRSIHSEGGFPVGGPITGYRVHPLTDEGVYRNAPVAKDDPGQWVRPADYFKDWMIRPSNANLYKAIAAARSDLFA